MLKCAATLLNPPELSFVFFPGSYPLRDASKFIAPCATLSKDTLTISHHSPIATSSVGPRLHVRMSLFHAVLALICRVVRRNSPAPGSNTALEGRSLRISDPRSAARAGGRRGGGRV